MKESRSRSGLRTAIVVGISAVVIAITVPNIWEPESVPGFQVLGVDAHYDVVSLPTDSLLYRAGLRAGDHIEPQTTSVAVREMLTGNYPLRYGDRIAFDVDRGGVRHAIVAVEQGPNRTFNGMGLVKRTASTVFIIFAAALLLLRPSTTLWGFFLYAIGSTNAAPVVLLQLGATPFMVGNTVLVTLVFGVLGPLGLLMFATRFPAESHVGVRPLVSRSIPFLTALLVVSASTYLLFLGGVVLPSWTDLLSYNLLPWLVTAIGLIALIAGYFEVDPRQRQRLRWVVAGFTIYYAGVLWENAGNYFPNGGWPPAWTNAGWDSEVLQVLQVLIPITAAYAVLKHHVLDLNFVIGRGLVYGILTSIAVAAFALVEWVVGGVLSQTKLATAGEVVAAIAIGFWLNGLHAQVDRFVDSTIFRRRHLAEKRLAEVASGLPHAETRETVASMLVREPIEALGLASGALFQRNADGFRCALAVGAEVPESIALVDGDALSVRLHGARGPVSAAQLGERFAGNNAFVVAMPVFVRHELKAIAFYGPHDTGEAIDPDEMRSLQSLCVGASAALDHLEAVELRRRLEESERALQALRIAMAPG